MIEIPVEIAIAFGKILSENTGKNGTAWNCEDSIPIAMAIPIPMSPMQMN